MKLKNQYLKILEYLHLSFNKLPYSIYSGYLLFFETTIMGKTADLAVVQKTNNINIQIFWDTEFWVFINL